MLAGGFRAREFNIRKLKKLLNLEEAAANHNIASNTRINVRCVWSVVMIFVRIETTDVFVYVCCLYISSDLSVEEHQSYTSVIESFVVLVVVDFNLTRIE